VDLNETQEELLEEVCEKCGATLSALAERFCTSPVLVSRDLIALKDAGLVKMVRRSECTPTQWEPTVAGLQARRALVE
jgi:DeoR/GlpR family transcriptional regulator of sugar metabolism